MSSTFFNYPTGEQQAQPPMLDMAFWGQRSQRDWRKLLAVMQTLRFRPNEVAIAAGHQADGVYVVGFGRFTANRVTIPEGHVIGIQPFFDKHPHDKATVAETDGELLHLSFAAFDTFAAREPELARTVLFELGRILSLQSRKNKE